MQFVEYNMAIIIIIFVHEGFYVFKNNVTNKIL